MHRRYNCWQSVLISPLPSPLSLPSSRRKHLFEPGQEVDAFAISQFYEDDAGGGGGDDDSDDDSDDVGLAALAGELGDD